MVATLTSLIGLGAQPLSWDEAVSVSAAQRSIPGFERLIQHTDAPLAAYYALVHGWLSLLGLVRIAPTEFWVRLPSAACALLAVIGTSFLARRLIDRRAALLAGVLLAVWPLLGFYAQDARPYAAATAAVVGATLALLRARDRPTVLRCTVYLLALIAATYLHLFALLALVPHIVVALRAGPARARLLVAQLMAVLAAVPLLLVALPQSKEIGWVPAVSLRRILGFGVTIWGEIAIAMIALGIGLWVGWTSLSTRRGKRRATPAALGIDARVLVIGWAVLPPVLLLAGSLHTPLVLPRYALVAVPAFVLLTVVGLRRLPRRARRVAVPMLLLAAVTTVAVQRAAPYKYENFRAAATLVDRAARPGDALVFRPPSFHVGYEYYATRWQAGGPGRHEPTEIGFVSGGDLRGTSIGGEQVSAGNAGSAFRRHSRVWEITDTRHQLAAPRGYRVVWHERYGGLIVGLATRLGTQ